MSLSEDVVRVHVENAPDLRAVKTEEQEPEHLVFGTRVIAAAAGYDTYILLLNEDPQRKDWSITTIDQPVIICHSVASAANPANQTNTVTTPPMGAVLTTGSAFTFKGSAPVWVAATGATPTRVSFALTRRGSA